MDVAIIGAGDVGRALALSLARAGHAVTLSSRDAAHAEQVAAEVGASSGLTPVQAAQAAHVVILAVPFSAVDAVAADLAPAVAGKLVIDVTNPLTPDYSGLAVEGTSAAELLQRRLPESAVVKAFNTVFASNQAAPADGLQAFVAADDPQARRQVAELAASMGFQPLEVGPLSAARTLEAMAFLNIGLNLANGWSWTSAWKLEPQG